MVHDGRAFVAMRLNLMRRHCGKSTVWRVVVHQNSLYRTLNQQILHYPSGAAFNVTPQGL